MVVVATAATGSAAAGDGEEGGDGYGELQATGTGGNGGGAHSGVDGGLRRLGEAPDVANRRRGLRRPKVEEDEDSGVSGLPAFIGSL